MEMEDLAAAKAPLFKGHASSNSVSHKRATGKDANSFREWQLEGAAWLLSLVIFVAVIALLNAYDGRVKPDWPSAITLAALVTLLMSIGQSAILVPVNSALGQIKWLWFLEQKRPLSDLQILDDGSKDPLGSAFVLFKRRGGLPSAFGSIMVIAALGVVTFTVQSIGEVAAERPARGTATVPVAAAAAMDVTPSYPGPTDEELISADPPFKAAAYNGLLNPVDTEFNITATCSTGNCTWSTFQTLQICTTCADITSHIKQEPGYPEVSGCGQTNTDGDDTCLNSVLPNGLQLNYSNPGSSPLLYPRGALFNISGSITGGIRVGTELSNQSIRANPDSIAFTESGSKLIDAMLIYTTELGGQPHAYECMLQYCVQAYNASTLNGIYSESANGTFHTDDSPAAQKLRPLAFVDVSNDHNGTSYIIESSSEIPPSSTFRVSNFAQAASSDFLGGLLQGVATQQNGAPALYTSDEAQIIYSAITGAANETAAFTTFEKIMRNLAASISRDMRMRPRGDYPDPVFARGSTTASRQIFVIKWGWLALPAILITAALALLVHTIFATRKAGIGVWKADINQALLHGLDDSLIAKFGALSGPKSVEREQKRVLVRLEDTGSGPRLRQFL